MSLSVITVTGKVEKLIAEGIQQTEHGNYLSLDPSVQQEIVKVIHQEVEKVSLQEEVIVLLCSPAIRMYLKQLLDRFLPQVVVLSYNELEPSVQVQRSEEHTSELQSRGHLVCRLLLEKKKNKENNTHNV